MEEEKLVTESADGALKENPKDEWPDGYFEKYFGIFADDPLEEPEELPWSLDAKREPFE